MHRWFTIVAGALCLLACGDPEAADAGSSPDAAHPSDAGLDAGMRDAGSPDADLDAGMRDAGLDAASDAGLDAAARTCAADDECGDDAWCRASEAGPSQCVARAGDGVSCGGNGEPWTQERCRAGADCVQLDPSLVDAPGVCAASATVAELEGTPSLYEGRWVAVLAGWVRQGSVGCSSSGCGDGCCDVCVSDLYLHDLAAGAGPRLALLTSSGITYDCRGDECALEATCDAVPDARYLAVGPFEVAAFREHRLRVEHLVSLPEPG